jgi:hypothetical protein
MVDERRKTFDDEGMQEALDADELTSPGGREQPRSIEPGDEICEPVLVERRRRKFVDDGIFRRLARIHQVVQTNQKIQRFTAVGVLTMVVFAALEYMGVLGPGARPIWARAVIDGIGAMLGFPK